MKFILIALFCSLFTFTSSYSQQEKDTDENIVHVKIYAMPWNGHYCRPTRTIENIKRHYLFYFEADGETLNIDDMFLSYDDCIERLSSQKALILSDSVKKTEVISLVELQFSNKKTVNVYFDNVGNYYFQSKWHIRNNGFYYSLFKYFSNEIVSEEILNEAKKTYIDDFWHDE